MIGTQKIIFKDGELIPVADDIVGEEPPFVVNEKGYVVVYHPLRKYWISVHKVVDTYHNGVKAKNIVIHHKDFNKQNNRIDNLVRMDKVEHFLYHSRIMRERWAAGEFAGEKHPSFGRKRGPETCEAISEGLKFFYAQHPGYLAGENHWNFWGQPSEQTHAKLIESHLGYRSTEEQIEKTRKSNTGKKRTPEQCKRIVEGLAHVDKDMMYAKISKALKGRPPSQNTIEAQKKKMKQLWADPEWKKNWLSKMHERHIIVTEDSVTKRRIGLRLWLDSLSEEERVAHRKKYSIAKLGKPLSIEHRQKLSEIRKQRWADPEYRARQSALIQSGKQRQKNGGGL